MEHPRTPPRVALSALTQTLRVSRAPFSFLAQVRKEYGDVFTLRLLGAGSLVLVCSPRLLEPLFKLSEDYVVAGEIRGKNFSYLMGDKSSISMDGKEYSRRRRATFPLLSGKKVLRQTARIRQVAESSLERWPTDRTFRLQPYLNRISFDAVISPLMGASGDAFERLAGILWRYVEVQRSYFVQMPFLRWNLGRLSPWGKFLAIRRELLAAVGAEVEERARRPAPEEADMIAAMLADEPDRRDDDFKEAVFQELVNMVVADPTSKALAWTLLGVLSDAAVLARLRQELDEVLAGGPIETGHLSRLPYLHAVVQEGLRCQPVVAFGGLRLVKKTFELGGYSIPEGSTLVQCLSETGRSDVFPHPHRFDPGNFLDRKVRNNDWMPFGGGSRICTGMGLAQLEIAVVVATIVQRVDLELGSGSTAPRLSGIDYEPANGLRVRVLGRRGAGSGSP